MFTIAFRFAGRPGSRRVTRGSWWSIWVITAALLFVSSIAAPLSRADEEVCSSSGGVLASFSCTVPAGVTKVVVLAVGGGGAGGNGGGAWEVDQKGYQGGNGGYGGSGAVVSCVVSVTVGQVLTAVVGKAGPTGEKVGVGTESGAATSAGDNGGDGGDSVITIAGTDVAFAAGGYGGEGGRAATSSGHGAEGVDGIGGSESVSFCRGDSARVVGGTAGTSDYPTAKSAADGTDCEGAGTGGSGGIGGRSYGEGPSSVYGLRAVTPEDSAQNAGPLTAKGCVALSFE